VVRVGVVGKIILATHGFDPGNWFVAALLVKVNEMLRIEFSAWMRVPCFLVLGRGGNRTATIVSVSTKASAINMMDFLLILNKTPKLAQLYNLFSRIPVSQTSHEGFPMTFLPNDSTFCAWAGHL
jgi:hypothetical protein